MTMLKLLGSILLMAFISSSSYAQQPLSADAGLDTIFCTSLDSFKLGGTPAAIGGKSPYIFEWDIYPKPFIPFPLAPQIRNYCSDFLDDTTLANPRLLWLPSEQKKITFILKVTDSSGQIAIDSVSHLQIQWLLSMGNIIIPTIPGDTQTITPMGFSGGIPPYTIDWGSDSLIIGDRFDYNVYFNVPVSRQIIIPNAPSPFWPKLVITDSVGCSISPGTFQQFIILASALEDYHPYKIDIFPNPIQDYLNIELPENQVSRIMLFDIYGRAIYNQKVRSNSKLLSINFKEFINGTYYVVMVTESGTITRRVLKLSN